MLGFSPDQLAALDKLFAKDIYSPSQVSPDYTKALIALYRKIYGPEPSEEDYKFLVKLRNGDETLSDANFWSTWSPTFWKLKKSYEGTRDRRAKLTARASTLGGSVDEKIYRECSADEATDAQNRNVLEQGAESFDKYKWIFVDTAHPPVQSKDPEYRLTITVVAGTRRMLEELAVQHVGTIDACVVTRCYTRLRSKGIVPNDTVPDEIGSFAIHVDVLDLFCQHAVKSITKAKK